ncbi:MAG: DNA-directed RNA polymerase [Fervidicoccaceae archaeon]|jgi:DNA-directed RNA polymerase subunit E'|uniref:DNA-directed RNA polymerase subunit Rpo7 n=1 Tax=Fervidicoccus fontis TaxID=683846 RepID=A0A7C2UKX3_9CREN|nr:MAG: DNA-directed RNA polymerase [Fervidicoccus sp.]HEU97590.1 DNA-directed RNA polymerase [Fervidicoccus fontis]
MFMVSKIRDVVRIPPERMNENLEEVAKSVLNSQYSGYYDDDLGIIIGVYDIEIDPIGKILHGDGGTYHWLEASVFSLKPAMNEVIVGTVSSVREFGIFVRIGPIEGFIHKSQISDEYVEYDASRQAFILKQSNRIIEKGDLVRARVIAFSFNAEKKEIRVQLTMRQPYLGKLPIKSGG